MQWLAGPQWTSPSDGAPFGEIEGEGPCRGFGAGETDRDYLCSAIVVGTQRSGEANSGPIESLSVSLSPDGRVRVNLERNG